MKDTIQRATGDRSKLTYDQRGILIETVLPNAIDWALNKPRLRDHGLQTLVHWGEPDPRQDERSGAKS
jgi:hypothetical protein